MMVSNRNLLFQVSIFGCHVSFRGCNPFFGLEFPATEFPHPGIHPPLLTRNIRPQAAWDFWKLRTAVHGSDRNDRDRKLAYFTYLGDLQITYIYIYRGYSYNPFTKYHGHPRKWFNDV